MVANKHGSVRAWPARLRSHISHLTSLASLHPKARQTMGNSMLANSIRLTRGRHRVVLRNLNPSTRAELDSSVVVTRHRLEKSPAVVNPKPNGAWIRRKSFTTSGLYRFRGAAFALRIRSVYGGKVRCCSLFARNAYRAFSLQQACSSSLRVMHHRLIGVK